MVHIRLLQFYISNAIHRPSLIFKNSLTVTKSVVIVNEFGFLKIYMMKIYVMEFVLYITNLLHSGGGGAYNINNIYLDCYAHTKMKCLAICVKVT